MEKVLQYPLVVYEILKNLNINDRRNCRLVCKLWNTEALKLLTNPLLDVFKFLSVRDLLNCRLVSKKWNTFAEVLLQKSSRVYFLGVPNIKKFNEEILQGKTLLEGICCTVSFGKLVHIDDGEVQQYLTKFGPCIKHMELIRAKWTIPSLRKLLHDQLCHLSILKIVGGILPSNPEGDRMILYHNQDTENPSPKLFPHLKEISFDMNILDNKHKIRCGFVEFLTDLFTSCPNLKSFWCESSSIYPRTFMHDFIVNDPGLLPNLTSLSTIIDYDQRRLTQLQSKQLPLTQLYLRIGNVNINVLHSLLQSLKTTLKKLGVNYKGNTVRKSECAKQFPSSKDLQHLELLDLIGFTGQLDFLSDFPNLKTLILKEVNMTNQFPFVPDELESLSLLSKLKEIILVQVEDYSQCVLLVNQLTNIRNRNIKCLCYHSIDEFFYDNDSEKTWAELQRDIYQFPFS